MFLLLNPFFPRQDWDAARFGPELENPDGPGGWDRTFGRSELPFLLLGRSWLLRLGLEWESVQFPSQLPLGADSPFIPQLTE